MTRTRKVFAGAALCVGLALGLWSVGPGRRSRASVAPVSTALAAALAKLEGDWVLEETGKAYWIGYTQDMRAIAKHGDAALPPLKQMAREGSERARLGAVLTIHYIGIQGIVAGRFVEGFTHAPARAALLELLDEEELQVQLLKLLLRDPWPTDLPRLFALLEAGTDHDWAFVKALQRYGLADPPVHPPLPQRLAELPCPIRGGQDVGYRAIRLDALRRLAQVVVERDLRLRTAWNWDWKDDHASGTRPLGSVLDDLTECEYSSLGDRLEYYVEGGKVHLCSASTARTRWLAWYARQPRPLRIREPLRVWWACYSGGRERVAALLDASPGSVDVRTPDDRETPLIRAAGSGHADVVRLLVERGADVRRVDAQGRSALHHAAAAGQAEVAAALLEAAAAVELKDAKGRTPLDLAAAAGFPRVVALLRGKGASVGVFAAAATGARARLIALLARDPALANAVDAERSNPLHHAARYGHAATVDELLTRGAKPDGTARGADTPLHVAAREGQVTIVRSLLKAGARVDPIAGLWGAHTPLEEAAQGGHLEVARVLIAAGARVNWAHSRGRPALQWACIAQRPDLVRLLLRAGADVHEADHNGVTALWWVSSEGGRHTNDAIAALLRAHGAKPVEPHWSR